MAKEDLYVKERPYLWCSNAEEAVELIRLATCVEFGREIRPNNDGLGRIRSQVTSFFSTSRTHTSPEWVDGLSVLEYGSFREKYEDQRFNILLQDVTAQVMARQQIAERQEPRGDRRHAMPMSGSTPQKFVLIEFSFPYQRGKSAQEKIELLARRAKKPACPELYGHIIRCTIGRNLQSIFDFRHMLSVIRKKCDIDLPVSAAELGERFNRGTSRRAVLHRWGDLNLEIKHLPVCTCSAYSDAKGRIITRHEERNDVGKSDGFLIGCSQVQNPESTLRYPVIPILESSMERAENIVGQLEKVKNAFNRSWFW